MNGGYLGSQEDVRLSMSEGLKKFDATKMVFNVWSINLNVKRELYERGVLHTVPYGAGNVRYEER